VAALAEAAMALGIEGLEVVDERQLVNQCAFRSQDDHGKRRELLIGKA
jgi:hypothetical protein